MKLFEVNNDVVTINIDTNVIRKFNDKNLRKMELGDYNEYLIEKTKNGNQDCIMKSISIIKDTLLKNGCSNYEQLYRKINDR